MKTITTLLLLFISIVSYADGGNGYGTKCNVHDLEPSLNLFYTSLDGQLNYTNSKGKEKTREITANIAIYNIANKKTKYLFSDTLNEKICEFYFETHYDSSLKKIYFNRNNGDYYAMNNIIGNVNLEKRLCSNNLLIITYSYKTQKYSLWISHKNGDNLRRVKVFSDEHNRFFDVKNQTIRFVRQVGIKIEIEDIKY
jgi:hypothetical protein